MAKAPGRNERAGMTVKQLFDRFPTEDSAREWFESQIWPEGRHCPRCGCTETTETPASETMPYHCPACRRYFSVRIGTLMERSKVSLRDWAVAIYLHLTSLKGVSSMKLHRDLGVTQKTAWFMLARIRKAFDDDDEPPFGGPIEVDEAYFGGKRANMSKAKRESLKGRGTVGKTAVVGAKDRESNTVRARVVTETTGETLQGFVRDNTAPGAKVFTDEATAYAGLGRDFDHEAVNHSVGEYVRGMATVNGIESFWATLRRAYKGVYHKISPKHLERYVGDFAGRHGIRGRDTIDMMAYVADGMRGKRLTYAALIADNGLESGARQ